MCGGVVTVSDPPKQSSTAPRMTTEVPSPPRVPRSSHPFVASNPVLRWPIVNTEDTITYHSGLGPWTKPLRGNGTFG